MRPSIDTLPVWEAQSQAKGCLLCHLRTRLESNYIEHYMGDSKMESDVRMEVNDKGFCPAHFTMMYEMREGKLGLALMTHTHLLARIQEMERALKNPLAAVAREKTEEKGPRPKSAFETYAREQAAQRERCAVCDRIDDHMETYYRTLIHLLEHDEAFAQAYAQGPGLCLEHASGLLDHLGRGLLSAKRRDTILRTVEVQRRQMQKDAEDLDWFIRKFDYRNADKPWGDARDALPRSIGRIAGELASTGEEKSE